uniref:Protein argonaute N-terminal domain-containing protein n=1 Tax=Nelumbo nucifera TaxID=4432 RepID=A0A822ZH88_NELNU|nr:TPA_asm: hypothetical protein HUJ06_002223 [Nelumbo nucifera]
MVVNPHSLVATRRPNNGGLDGAVIPLLANHYNVEISPHPSKEVARMIKQKLVQDYSEMLSGARPAFDGRKNLFCSVEFQNDKLEYFIRLPMPTAKAWLSVGEHQHKLFLVNIKLASKLYGKELSRYLSKEGED